MYDGVIVHLSSYITHRISNFNLTLLIFVSQSVTAAIIDFLLGSTISTSKIIGGVAIIIGLTVNIIIDHNDPAMEKTV